MITIVDYGLGNFASVKNMCKRISVPCQITSNLEVVEKAEKLILPGVGAFDTAMSQLKESGMQEVLNKKATKEKVPIMGICLGMQLLMSSSEEGNKAGLGWIKGKAIKFNFTDSLYRVPHMGWNKVKMQQEHPILKSLESSKFYFVHSYYVLSEDKSNSLLQTNYGVTFDSAVISDNIFGFQFHPEKSHSYGMTLFENFSKI